MAASIILAHDSVWGGPTRKGDKSNRQGYFENTQLSREALMKACDWRWAKEGALSSWPDSRFPLEAAADFRKLAKEVLAEQGYDFKRHWLLKEPVLSPLHKVACKAFPRAYWVWCVRNQDDMAASIVRYYGPEATMRDARKFIGRFEQVRASLRRMNINYAEVRTDRLVSMDLRELVWALRNMGIANENSERYAELLISPELWHGKTTEVRRDNHVVSH